MRLHDLGSLLCNMFYPNRCSICNELTEYPAPICKVCLEKLAYYKMSNFTSRCQRCGHKTVNCICKNIPNISKLLVAFIYAGEAKRGTLSLKKHNSPKAFEYYAHCILEERATYKVEDITCVTYIPTTHKKRKERGHNQAEELARYIALHLHVPLVSPPIVRQEESRNQHQLDFTERKRNAAESYLLAEHTQELHGTVVLVDDVVTTGFTLDHCARLLLRSGADRIVAFTITAPTHQS